MAAAPVYGLGPRERTRERVTPTAPTAHGARPLGVQGITQLKLAAELQPNRYITLQPGFSEKTKLPVCILAFVITTFLVRAAAPVLCRLFPPHGGTLLGLAGWFTGGSQYCRMGFEAWRSVHPPHPGNGLAHRDRWRVSALHCGGGGRLWCFWAAPWSSLYVLRPCVARYFASTCSVHHDDCVARR